jgi:hypothetical protein
VHVFTIVLTWIEFPNHLIDSSPNPNKVEEVIHVLDIFVKSRKNRVSTLSLVIHRVRLEKNLQKNTLAFNRG